jgi:phenylacetate-CoA ligase
MAVRMGGSERAGQDEFIEFRSGLAGVAWPAVPDERGMTLLALLYQLERSEWWPAAEIRRRQFRQLESLLSHAAAHAPYWREALPAAGFRSGEPLSEEIWRRIPVLSRQTLQRHGEAMRAGAVPQFHGAVHQTSTSGSTARPVTVVKTELSLLVFEAIALREALWQRRDLAGTLAVVYSKGGKIPRDGQRVPHWNQAIGATMIGGPGIVFEDSRPAPELARALARRDPKYLMVHPSILAEIGREAARQGLRFPSLAGIVTYGEQLSADVRAAATERFGVPVTDIYSSEEAGYLALQCPEGAGYHAQSEAVLIEVLDESGAECAPGEAGRVVVTPLHNFAMPLVRYAIGDLAEAGGACACGRGLPVLNRILGRTRNLMQTPDGSRFWPRFTPLYEGLNLPIEQFQLIQLERERLELKLVTARPLTAAEEQRVRAALREICRHDMRTDITYHASIPRGPSGKFEDFICEIGRAAEAG